MNIELTDERGNRPSASGYERIIGCPGSFQLEQRFPETRSDPVADRGTRIHHAFETEDTSELSPDELTDYQQGVKFLEMLVAQWQRDFGISEVEELPRETRLWLHHPETLTPLASGRMDRWYQGRDSTGKMRVLVVDLKSGWATHVQPSPRNPQMRLYALLVWRELDVPNIRVAIDRAKSFTGANDFADYTESDLRFAEQLLLMHLWHAEQPDAPRYPGEHCFYCRGKQDCPQAAAYSLLPGVIARNAAPDTRKVVEQVGLLTDADLFRIWDASGIVGRVIDAVDERLKGLPKERLAELGLELPEHGSKNDSIERTKECFEYLRDVQQVHEDNLWELLQLPLGQVREMMKEVKQLTDKGAKGWCEEFLRDYIKFDFKRPSLRKLKEK